MIDTIKKLREEVDKLEPDPEEQELIVGKASRYISQFIIDSRSKSTKTNGGQENIKALTISEEGQPLDSLLNIFHSDINSSGINTTSGGHMGYIPGGGLWSGAIGDMLAAGTNRFSGVYYSSPGAVVLENQLIRWMCRLFGFPNDSHGVLTSGGSIANLVALQTARDVKGVASSNVKKAVIYLTGQAHHCINKALQTLGLNEAVQRIIPMNAHYQMDVDVLRSTLAADKAKGLAPFLVIATAGTTDSGSVDPIDSIADVCQENRCWLHVDAAYGGFFILLGEVAGKFKGIERADTLVIDPHKGLFIPYGLGVVLVRSGNNLIETFSHQASYMQDTYGFDEISPADCGPELTKHFRGMRLWVPLHLHGLKPFRAALQEKILLTRYFRERIRKLGFETGPEPQLTVTLFRYPEANANAFNQKLIGAIHDDGRCFFSSTMIDGQLWLRCAILNFRTHLEDVDRGLRMIEDCVNSMGD